MDPNYSIFDKITYLYKEVIILARDSIYQSDKVRE